MYCTRCGTANGEDARFCIACGDSLSPVAAAPVQPVPPAAPPVAAPIAQPLAPPVAAPLPAPTYAPPASPAVPPAQSRGRISPIAIVALTLVVVLAGVGGWLFYKKIDTERRDAQLDAAAAFMRAELGKDVAGVKSSVPAATVAALDPAWFDRQFALWSGSLTYKNMTRESGESLTQSYDVDATDMSTSIRFRSEASGTDSALVTFEARSNDDSLLTAGTIELQLVDDRWAVAHYTSGDVDLTFWSKGRTPAELAKELELAVPQEAVEDDALTPDELSSGELPAGHPSIGGTGSGMTPEEQVTAHYQAWLDEDWQTAYDLLPASQREDATVSQFREQVAAYGLRSFQVLSADPEDDSVVVTVDLDLGENGRWTATWTYVQQDGEWVPVSRKLSM